MNEGREKHAPENVKCVKLMEKSTTHGADTRKSLYTSNICVRNVPKILTSKRKVEETRRIAVGDQGTWRREEAQKKIMRVMVKGN